MTLPSDSHMQMTRNYYDSADADNFYFRVWGGEDIHIGIYEPGENNIALASRRTIERMALLLKRLDGNARVLDLGAGYGGAARFLARFKGCHVTALNLSARENARSRALTAAAGLEHLVSIVEGSYEAIPAQDASFDVVWSQDAMLHSANKDAIFAEVARVLKPGGEFVFSDPMESGHCSREDIRPVLERIHLSAMGSFEGYAGHARRHGLEVIELIDLTAHLVHHYACIRNELQARRGELSSHISESFIERMLAGLEHWVRAGERGHLSWGILHLRKSEPMPAAPEA